MVDGFRIYSTEENIQDCKKVWANQVQRIKDVPKTIFRFKPGGKMKWCERKTGVAEQEII